MNQVETIEFYKQQASIFEIGLSAAIEAKNLELAIFNVGQVFKAQIMQGLITWRMGEDPKEFLRNASKLVLDVVNGGDLGSLPQSALPLEKAAFIASLVGMQGYPVEVDGLESDRLLDALIGKALLGNGEFTLGGGELALIQSLPSSIAQKSYLLYVHLLLGEVGFEEGVREGEALFDARKSDAFYSGGDEIEGGGDDSEFVVDFRLGAILNKIGSKAKSIHAWRWS